MTISRRADYAVLAAIELAQAQTGVLITLRELAARQEIPEKYLEQVLRALRTAGLVTATRGSQGGYQLTRPPKEISVLDLYEAAEGPVEVEALEHQSRPGPMVVYDLWESTAAVLRAHLTSLTLADLVKRYRANLDQGESWVI